MCTANPCFARMTLVSCMLEAHGLDAMPGAIGRPLCIGGQATIEILEVAPREEIVHVVAGPRRLERFCAREGIDPEVTFRGPIGTHFRGGPCSSFNVDARLRANFTRGELDRLAGPAL